MGVGDCRNLTDISSFQKEQTHTECRIKDIMLIMVTLQLPDALGAKKNRTKARFQEPTTLPGRGSNVTLASLAIVE